MYIPLQTCDVWNLGSEFTPNSFIAALPILLQPDDIIAVGAYAPTPTLIAAFSAMNAEQRDAEQIYFTSFAANRSDYHLGRSFEVTSSAQNIRTLSELFERNIGQADKALPFDHLLAYRPGNPVVPLLCFHDAFTGGELFLIQYYLQEIVERFAKATDAKFHRENNPELRISPSP